MNERDMSLLKAVSEAVREQLSGVSKKYDDILKAQSEEISRLTGMVRQLKEGQPDGKAIASSVLAQITLPTEPELPDIAKMVNDAVSSLHVPVPETPELPDIAGMVRQAVAEIELPQPEKLPDIHQIVKDAMGELEVPKAPELPDIEGMVRDAVSALELPQPEKLPDLQQMIKEAVSALPRAKDGEPGDHGKDALQIEILPCMDQGKSYPRGTYAIHQGGLWRSYQKTTGMNGWECLVDGISDIDITQAGERNFTVTAIKSSGEKTEKTFSVPVMLYRDIFKEGEKYYPGDSVTWGGSVWYCHEETGDKPGETGSKGWKLAVKRGRDARSKP